MNIIRKHPVAWFIFLVEVLGAVMYLYPKAEQYAAQHNEVRRNFPINGEVSAREPDYKQCDSVYDPTIAGIGLRCEYH